MRVSRESSKDAAPGNKGIAALLLLGVAALVLGLPWRLRAAFHLWLPWCLRASISSLLLPWYLRVASFLDLCCCPAEPSAMALSQSTHTLHAQDSRYRIATERVASGLLRSRRRLHCREAFTPTDPEAQQAHGGCVSKTEPTRSVEQTQADRRSVEQPSR